jgi:phosphoenolpyruvate phosphomutase
MQNDNSKNNGRVDARGNAGAGDESVETALLFNGGSQVGAGVYDGPSALLAGKWKFDFVWVSSFCCSAARGLPDAGIIGPEDILNVVRCVRRSVALPIVVDLDSGHGDAVKIYYVVRAMIEAGATALCIEDNPISKRCSLYDGYERILVSVEEHVARLRAAKEALRKSGGSCKIIARTEALVAGMGVDEALRRSRAYVEAGADAIFIQSLDATGKEVLAFGRTWQRRTPLFLAPTRLPQISKSELFAAGASHIIFANQGLRAAHAAMDHTFGILSQAESSLAVEKHISPVAVVAASVGAETVRELEAFLADETLGQKHPEKTSAVLKKTLAAPAAVFQRGGLGARFDSAAGTTIK